MCVYARSRVHAGYPRDDESRQHMHSYEYDSDQARTMPFCMAHACMDEYSDALGLFTDQLRNSGSHLPTASQLSGLCLSVTIGPVTRRLVRHQNAPPGPTTSRPRCLLGMIRSRMEQTSATTGQDGSSLITTSLCTASSPTRPTQRTDLYSTCTPDMDGPVGYDRDSNF